MSDQIDVLTVIGRDAELALSWNGRSKASSHAAYAESVAASNAVAELIDAAKYALRTRDDAGALSDTAEHNLRAALANCMPVGAKP